MSSLKHNSHILASHVLVANTSWSRVKGLLGRSSLSPSEVLWIKPCNSIHTFFMKFSIDVIFVDRKLRVKKVIRNLAPGRMPWPVWSAHTVFEFAAGALGNCKIEEGDQLHVDP